MRLFVKRLNEHARMPAYASRGAAGLDLRACLDHALPIQAGATVLIPTGIAVAIPAGYVGLVRDRSSVALRGLHTVAGVIDSDYRGEIQVAMHNAATSEVVVSPQDRLAQMLVMRCPTVDVLEVTELAETERGSGGFGSTGDR